MWIIEEGLNAARAIRFGKHRIAIGDITGITLEEVRTRNVKGLVTGAFGFFCVAGTLAYFVVEQGAMLRLLFGGFFLAGLGFSGLHEAAGMKKISHYELMLTLTDGRHRVYERRPCRRPGARLAHRVRTRRIGPYNATDLPLRAPALVFQLQHLVPILCRHPGEGRDPRQRARRLVSRVWSFAVPRGLRARATPCEGEFVVGPGLRRDDEKMRTICRVWNTCVRRNSSERHLTHP